MGDLDLGRIPAKTITMPLKNFHFGLVLFQAHFKPDIANIRVPGHDSQQMGFPVATDQHRRMRYLRRFGLV